MRLPSTVGRVRYSSYRTSSGPQQARGQLRREVAEGQLAVGASLGDREVRELRGKPRGWPRVPGRG
jgi:hypothetical protein